jgi:RHS repeat-associated protein
MTIDQYIWSPRYVDSPIVRFHDSNGDGDLLDAGDNVRYYTTDANHNVTATIDGATGDVVNRYSYTAYGKATVYEPDWSEASELIGSDGPLYCGYFFDAETANYCCRNRYLSTALGTFINRDPIGYEGGMDLYEYCGDDPLTRTDPMGQMSYVTVTGFIIKDHGDGYADFQCNCPAGYTSDYGPSHVFSHRPKDHVPTLTCFRPSNWDRVCNCVAYAWAGACAGVKCAANYTFDTLADAGKWIHDNPGKATVGAVVFVGGTAFIVMTGGSGALVLAPCAAL